MSYIVLAKVAIAGYIILLVAMVTVRLMKGDRRNDERVERRRKKPSAGIIALWLVPLLIGLLAARHGNGWVYYIPSEAMIPTLQVNDKIAGDMTAYGSRDPKFGEIVLFKAPPEALSGELRNSGKKTIFVKRVIGVPGDEIYIKRGYIEVNGKKLNRMSLRTILSDMKSPNHIGHYMCWKATSQDNANSKLISVLACGETPVRDMMGKYSIGGIQVALGPGGPMVRLTRDGVYVDGRKLTDNQLKLFLGPNARIIIHPGEVVRNGTPLDETYIAEDPDSAYPLREPDYSDPFSSAMVQSLQRAENQHKLKITSKSGLLQIKLMPSQYFVMGDNRNNSSDSRLWGPLSRDRVIGKATTRIWPYERVGELK